VARVLVIDDEVAIGHVLRYAIESRHHEVILADDGLRGIAMARRQRPDAIVLDLMMPLMDGHGVLDALQQEERTRNVPVLVLTAMGLESVRDRCLEQGAAAVLHKPFDPADVALAIEELLATV
jgi:two-component system, OmpR family, response regulator RpaA